MLVKDVIIFIIKVCFDFGKLLLEYVIYCRREYIYKYFVCCLFLFSVFIYIKIKYLNVIGMCLVY